MENELRALFIQQRVSLLSGANVINRKQVKNATVHKDESDASKYFVEMLKKHNGSVGKCGKNEAHWHTNNLKCSKEGGDVMQSIALKTLNHPATMIKRTKKDASMISLDIGDSTTKETQASDVGLIQFDNFDDAISKDFVAEELVNRLKTENLLNFSKSANSEALHDPRTCQKCKKVEGKILEAKFLKHHATKVESRMLDRKIDDVIHTMDTVFMIGQLAASLPKHSDSPEKIWARLLHNEDLSGHG